MPEDHIRRSVALREHSPLVRLAAYGYTCKRMIPQYIKFTNHA
jgi:hypothetical protein